MEAWIQALTDRLAGTLSLHPRDRDRGVACGVGSWATPWSRPGSGS